jgi:dihydropteroate synthase
MVRTLASLLPSDGRAAVMGILNITPDSFSDGGQLFTASCLNVDALMVRAHAMVAAGVDIFDVGGESTRPGASPVATADELARVVPVVRLLKKHFAVPVSVDTSNPEVICAAAAEGADLINDVRALTRPGALAAAAKASLPVCLMHTPAEPHVMQLDPRYEDVVAEVSHFLLARVEQCLRAGLQPEQMALDPGFGFGKTLDHNIALFKALPELAGLGYPLLVGVSRKRMIAGLLGSDSADRTVGSVALAVLAVQRGAKIVRVHDVRETVDALTVVQKVTVEGSTV